MGLDLSAISEDSKPKLLNGTLKWCNPEIVGFFYEKDIEYKKRSN